MAEMWSTLAPLIVASAALPLQIIVALVLVRSSMRVAYAWVAGMTTIRLLQGILFVFVLSARETRSEAGTPAFLAGLQLVLAVVLYVAGLRKALASEDEDAPPPKWIAKAGSMSALTAFAAGAGYVAISAKFAIFTLGAISAILDAHLSAQLAILTFILFVVLAQSGQLTILALAGSSSRRAAQILEGFAAWLERNNRIISVAFSVIFGTWFLFKALSGLGLI